MADLKAKVANAIPTGTGPKSESSLLEKLKACNVRNFDTLADVALSGIKGEPLDDKSYLMERIIQLTSELPLHERFSDTLTHQFLNELWTELDHPPQSYLGYDFRYRKADGSNNNIMWPHIGKAGQPYARSVRPRKMQPPQPDPGVIFDSVLARGEFRPHPNKISSVLFYVASIIIHDCFHTSHEDYAISETSSYLDLAPLYGSNEKQQMKMRTRKDGKLKPDCFSDNRILGFPPGVGILLIMFNRFHNMVVENLAKVDENGRFSRIKSLDRATRRRTGLTPKLDDTEPTPDELYDEALFQTGRLITCGLYINIVLGDYVRTILGLNRADTHWNLDPRQDYGKTLVGEKIPEAGGNQCSAEFSLVYRWHSTVSKRDEDWTTKFIKKISEDPDLAQKIPDLAKMDPKDPMVFFLMAQAWADDLKNQDPQDRNFEDLTRTDGRFSDDDLCRVWVESVDDVAGAFGANHVPHNLKFVEVLSILQSRAWNLASLNEFREYFKLAPHKTFESINPDPKVAKSLERLYKHPDNVEIYPGIVVESAKKSISPGSGLCASWTTSRAILADAVALTRGDRFYTVDYTPANLTNWGFKTASYDLDINHGAVFYKLVLNAFPNHIAKNSIYAHFPLVNPPENKTLLKGMNRAHLYGFDKPKPRSKVEVEPSAEVGTKAESLLVDRLPQFGADKAAMTDGAAKMSFSEAVLSNDKWKSVATEFYTSTLEQLWQNEQYELGGWQEVDVMAHVLNAAHAHFIKTILDIPISPDGEPDEPHSLLSTLGHVFETAFNVDAQPRGLYTAVRDLTHWFVGAVESAFGKDANGNDLGQAAFAKLKQVNGPHTKEMAWHDILPMAALMLTHLSRSSAATVESAIPKSKSATSKSTDTVAYRVTTDVGGAKKGDVFVVDVSKDDTSQLGPDIKLSQEVAEIANKAIKDIISKVKGIERTPGPGGTIKKFKISGEVKYLNATESDYVTYPVGLKVRWQK